MKPATKNQMTNMADQLDGYLKTCDALMFCQNCTKKEYMDARKTIKDTIENLRKGKWRKVFDEEGFTDTVMHDRAFAQQFSNPNWDGEW